MSLKRSRDEAGFTSPAEPALKKHLDSSLGPALTVANAEDPGDLMPLQEVFAVIEEIKPYSGIVNRTTLGLYSTVKDANNEVFKLRQQYFVEGRIPHKTAAKRRYLYSGGLDSKGYAWWAFGPDHQAVPFVHGVKICVSDWVVEAPGNEEAEDWSDLRDWVESDEEDDPEEDQDDEPHLARYGDDGEEDFDDDESDYSEGENDRPWH
ncbi:hypothetical protein BP5796_02585 [Coleophoma crateriformis]|uniref:Uncharacterized protein n=1 Tax=Coleophoma crateriformis TaxID=565419 RepID=A0A3D8SYR1_9HELO|nr:hypothetical protein BP5796_02585 [Coleophoma crateriformis]